MSLHSSQDVLSQMHCSAAQEHVSNLVATEVAHGRGPQWLGGRRLPVLAPGNLPMGQVCFGWGPMSTRRVGLHLLSFPRAFLADYQKGMA